MWHRDRMTPIEYEEYLLSLNEEEWDAHIKSEEEAYQKMTVEAAKKAKENNKNRNDNGVGVAKNGK